MRSGWLRSLAVLCSLSLAGALGAQEPAPKPPETPEVPKGVEVLARGPVHEAFAAPTAEPAAPKPVPKQPPKPIDEMPPEQKPEGDVQWIGGYWAWDDERNDYLWVSGIWRTAPPGKKWVAGYWRQEGGQWQWVPGFWTPADPQGTTSHQLTYLPEPPKPPETAPPGEAPNAESFYVPGHWTWHPSGYVVVNGVQTWRDGGYHWVAGYWAHVQPGYVWVPAHYRWTPTGYLYIPGYWDLAVAQRGVLYAPVIVDPVLVGPTFVYTPAYAVSNAIVVDAFFVRPAYCHYYFGDYYGPVYRNYGYVSVVSYSRSHYDAVFVYARYEHRYEPAWEHRYVEVTLARHAGRAPLPPRTLVQQNNIVVNNVTNVTNVNVVNKNTTVNNVLVPASKLSAATGTRSVAVKPAERVQAAQQAQAVRQVAEQRTVAEVRAPAGPSNQPRTATLNVPHAQPVGPRPAASTTATHAANTPATRAPATGGLATGNTAQAHGLQGTPGAMTNRAGTPQVTTTRPPPQAQRPLPPAPQRAPQRPPPGRDDRHKPGDGRG